MKSKIMKNMLPFMAAVLLGCTVSASGAETGFSPKSTLFFEGASTEQPVRSMEDAKEVVQSMAENIGMDERTQFEPWRTLTDTTGNQYYVFRQMFGGVTVSGGAVKVVADPDGNMLGLVSSVESDIPDEETKEGIDGAGAEAIVLNKMEEKGFENLSVLKGYTEQIILPVNLSLDPDSEEEKEEVRFVWVVYTNNDENCVQGGSELPYLAHYVTLDGEYLYSLPTIIPADEAGNTGYQASYVFEFMEPAEYEGTVTLHDGTEKEIAVTLMRDTRTGMYYLGNLERRIVVADCYEFLYNDGNVVLEASADNTGWDPVCLLSLYHYCQAWDYYNAIGWKSGDGKGTPMIILKDYCDKEHEPVNNAAYAGSYYGWQVFLTSSVNTFSQALDVLAHEFTHSVTHSVMTYNAYSNDYGAINEAISDIQGNICEMMAGETEDTEWEIGENSGTTLRSMSHPHEQNQPEYAWDLYYKPNVKMPTLTNDRGGVHSNSSLLNRVAYVLCEDGGMSLEEARSFWFAVDCSMVPGTNYRQLSELMPWVLSNLHMEKYLPSLRQAIEQTSLDSEQIPETFDSNRALVTLTLPDDEQFNDGNWLLTILSINPDEIKEQFDKITEEGENGNAFTELGSRMEEAFEQFLFEDAGKEIFRETFAKWVREYFMETLTIGTGAAGQDGRTVRMVTTPGYTLPVLIYLKFAPNDIKPETVKIAFYAGGKWVGAGSLESGLTETIPQLSGDDDKDGLFFKIDGGGECRIPDNGLEKMKPEDLEIQIQFPGES